MSQHEVTGTIDSGSFELVGQSLGNISREATVPARFDLKTPLIQRRYLCGGEREWDGALQEVTSPLLQNSDGTRRVIGAYPTLGAEQALDALEAAKQAYDGGLGSWPAMSPQQRIDCMRQFTARMLERREDVVTLLVLEIAKTVPDAEKEFDRTIELIEDTIAAYEELVAADQARSFDGVSAQLARSPHGVVLNMGPFNYPLNETLQTLVPALLMGNTSIVKPPRIGVLLFEPLMEAFKECFPSGVVNFIYGDGREIITPLMQSGEVDFLSFIGSTPVAKAILGRHPAEMALPRYLGLGSVDPAVILPGADLHAAAEEGVRGALTFNGQRCTALKRFFIPSVDGAEFAAELGRRASALKRGQPWEEGVRLTPLAEADKAAKTQELIEDAVAHGARIMNPDGGREIDGVFVPAVLYPVTPEMRIYREEQFGPVVPVIPYDQFSEVTAALKSASGRHQASVFGAEGQELEAAVEAVSRLVHRVNVNTQCQRGPDALPFTGTGEAGIGTISISEALLMYSTPRLVVRKAT